jgi:hypothetical protein
MRQEDDEFARRQAVNWPEIADCLDSVIGRHSSAEGLAHELSGQGNAYAQWVVWRAFLAINGLVSNPGTSRNFTLGSCFQPLAPAPDDVLDMIFEYIDFVLAVEVSLVEEQCQEAAEGEPVRRHIAQLVEDYAASGKKVYGLFLANKVDSNTAETFRLGVWYTPTDERMSLDIVPLTLAQFRDFFVALFETNQVDHRRIRALLEACAQYRHLHAPEWKREIALRLEQQVRQIRAV